MSFDKDEMLDKTKNYVKAQLLDAEPGHDWLHVQRVHDTAMLLAEGENVDHFVIQLGAYLHDIGDAKFNNGNEKIGISKIASFLHSIAVPEMIIDSVIKIVEHISFRKHFEHSDYRSRELEILQDADRLDAIGAIGIARAFSFGAYKGNPFYDPQKKPDQNINKKTYIKGSAPTINHFYEKLLKLKSMMNTSRGRMMATDRHRFMVNYLRQFYREANIDHSIYENS